MEWNISYRLGGERELQESPSWPVRVSKPQRVGIGFDRTRKVSDLSPAQFVFPVTAPSV